MESQYLTLIATSAGSVATLAGVALNGWMTRSREARQHRREIAWRHHENLLAIYSDVLAGASLLSRIRTTTDLEPQAQAVILAEAKMHLITEPHIKECFRRMLGVINARVDFVARMMPYSQETVEYQQLQQEIENIRENFSKVYDELIALMQNHIDRVVKESMQ